MDKQLINTISVVEIENLRKVYPDGTLALDDINLSLYQGEVLALLGPNGAGKSTLISCLCGIARVSGGSIRVGEGKYDPSTKSAKSIVGLVPQVIRLPGKETVLDSIKFSLAIYNKPSNEEYIEQILNWLLLSDKRHVAIEKLSGGMKRRVVIAKALVHEPRVLFLDEPSAGVDVATREVLWDLVSTLRRSGVAIVLTTHYMEEAERLADRVAVIEAGRIVLVESKNELLAAFGKRRLRIETALPLIGRFKSLEDFCHEINDKQVHVELDSVKRMEEIGKLLIDLTGEGAIITRMEITEPSLQTAIGRLKNE